MIAKEITPTLLKIEELIIYNDTHLRTQPNYSKDAFRAACCIFMHVIMDKMYTQMDGMDLEDKMKMTERAGKDLSNFVYTYTNINTKKLYK